MFAVQGRLHAANDGNLSFAHKQLKDAAKLHTVFSYITMLIFFFAPFEQNIAKSSSRSNASMCRVYVAA